MSIFNRLIERVKGRLPSDQPASKQQPFIVMPFEYEEAGRQEYSMGSKVVKAGSKIKEAVDETLDKLSGVTKDAPGRTAKDRGVVVGKKRTAAYKTTEQIKGAAKAAMVIAAGEKMYDMLTKEEQSEFEKAFSKAHNAGKDTFMFEGQEFTTEVRKGKMYGGKMKYNEGGAMPMESDVPVDTYPNIPPEEMAAVEASQLPDDEMEEEYVGFILDESLDEEEQEYLLNALASDDKLSDIFDRVIIVASEFSGAGPVEGPGDGTSDSIPARLSDGEFVFTEKATKQLGAENLQRTMDEAERAYDGGLMKKAVGGAISDPLETEKYRRGDPYEDKQEEQVNQLMIGANRMPSLLTR